MTYPIRPLAGTGADAGLPGLSDDGRPRRALPLTRRYEVAYLSNEGEVITANRVAPAMEIFEEAFSAFSRGTLIATPDGPVAIEDLVPGQLITTEDGPRMLRWRGALTVIPGQPTTTELTRLSADCFGPSRPMHDLQLGPSARFLSRKPDGFSRLRFRTPENAVDGESIVSVRPVAPVPLYHLVLDQQELIFANGLETPSYHPSLGAERGLVGDLVSLFLCFFPYLNRLEDFGAPLDRRISPRIVA